MSKLTETLSNLSTIEEIAEAIDTARLNVSDAEATYLETFAWSILDSGRKPADVKRALVRSFNWTDKTFANRKSDVMNLQRAAKLNGFGADTSAVIAYVEFRNEADGLDVWSLQNAAKRFGQAANQKAAKKEEPTEPTEQDGQDGQELSTEQAVGGDRVAAAMAIVSGMTADELEAFGGVFLAHVRKVREAAKVAA